MPPVFTKHVYERMRKRQISQEDVLAVLDQPVDEVYDPDNRSYKVYGHTAGGWKIYVAVTDTSWQTGDPVIKTVVKVS